MAANVLEPDLTVPVAACETGLVISWKNDIQGYTARALATMHGSPSLVQDRLRLPLSLDLPTSDGSREALLQLGHPAPPALLFEQEGWRRPGP